MEAKHQEFSKQFFQDLSSFTAENKGNNLGLETLQILSLKIESTKQQLENLAQEKTDMLNPKQAIVEDWLNIKRTSFYKQLKICFLQNFLSCEAIALGTFIRRFFDYSGSSPLSTYEWGIPFAKLFTAQLKPYDKLETRHKALSLATLHHHSFKEMENLSEVLSTGIMYRYQNQTPYLREEESGIFKLAPIIAEQVIDYALESKSPLSIEEMVIYGTLHKPSWLKEEDAKGNLNLTRRGWTTQTIGEGKNPQINTLTIWIGKTAPYTEKEVLNRTFKRNFL